MVLILLLGVGLNLLLDQLLIDLIKNEKGCLMLIIKQQSVNLVKLIVYGILKSVLEKFQMVNIVLNKVDLFKFIVVFSMIEDFKVSIIVGVVVGIYKINVIQFVVV